MTRDLVADVNGSLREAFARLAAHAPRGESRQFGSLLAVSSGLSLTVSNVVFVFGPPPREDLEAAVAWMRGRDVPFQVTVVESASGVIEDLAGDLGLVAVGEMPGMAVDPLDEVAPRPAAAEVSEVTDSDGLEDFAGAFASAFGVSHEVARSLHPPSLLTDDELRLLVGRVSGRPVACGMLSRTGDVAGVYTVGVIEGFRRRGIGEAVTRAVLRTGHEAGCAVGVLQASEVGYRIYERLGFETVVTYCVFEPAA